MTINYYLMWTYLWAFTILSTRYDIPLKEHFQILLLGFIWPLYLLYKIGVGFDWITKHLFYKAQAAYYKKVFNGLE